VKTIVQIEPAYETALRAAALADFDAMMRAAAGPPVGGHDRRETVPIEIAVDEQPRRFFLKRVFNVPPKHAFWPLFRGRLGRSQPWREWHMLGELAAAGIPAMQRAAFGERRRFGMPRQAFLLVEAVPMEHTLRDWLVPGFPKPPLDGRQRRRLILEFGRLVGQLHRRGFVWPDLHPKHIFAAPVSDATGDGRWDFVLIDVERMTRQPQRDAESASPTANDYTLDELIELDSSFSPLPVTARDRKCFLAGYWSSTNERKMDRVRAKNGRAVASPAAERLNQGVPPVLSRALTPRLPDDYEHPHCRPLRERHGLLVDERIRPTLEAVGIRCFEDVFTFGAGESRGKLGLPPFRERIRISARDGTGGTKAFFLKRYNRPPLSEQLRRIRESRAQRSTAWRELHFLRHLAELGIPVAKAAAFGEEMHGRRERRSFLITQEINGISLEKLAAQTPADGRRSIAWSDRREIIRQLALLTLRLHDHGLFHRDFYLCHLFLTRNADGAIVLHVIDLARMIEQPRFRRRWQIKDLAALDYSAPRPLVTRADRLRFLYHYLPSARHLKPEARRVIRDVQARVRQTARHDLRRARRWEGKSPA
jgi:tRNA A-37 threonylcarbamoyl transferase component Bud32